MESWAVTFYHMGCLATSPTTGGRFECGFLFPPLFLSPPSPVLFGYAGQLSWWLKWGVSLCWGTGLCGRVCVAFKSEPTFLAWEVLFTCAPGSGSFGVLPCSCNLKFLIGKYQMKFGLIHVWLLGLLLCSYPVIPNVSYALQFGADM